MVHPPLAVPGMMKTRFSPVKEGRLGKEVCSLAILAMLDVNRGSVSLGDDGRKATVRGLC